MDGVPGEKRAKAVFDATQGWLARVGAADASSPGVSRPFSRACMALAPVGHLSHVALPPSSFLRDPLTHVWPQIVLEEMRLFLDSNWEPPLMPAEKDWILQRSRCPEFRLSARARI